MRIKNIVPSQEEKRNINKQVSYKGATPEKVFSLLANPDSLARTVTLETFVTGGRSINAYKRGGFPEFRETFTDNLISAIFWMKGVDMCNKIGDFIGKKVLKLPTTEFDVGKDALRTPFKNLAAEVGKGLTPEKAQALEKKLAVFKFSKIIASTLLATGFVGFALPKINQAITRSISDQARTIRVPVHMVETINKMVRVSRLLVQELGREPSDEEIAVKMGIEPSRVEEIRRISQLPVSLETPIGEEEDSQLGDFIEDHELPSPDEAAAGHLLHEQIEDMLSTLSDREREVLHFRFGLEDGHSYTLEEVGKKFNVTRERIRQIEAKALRKLRQPSKKLKDFLD